MPFAVVSFLLVAFGGDNDFWNRCIKRKWVYMSIRELPCSLAAAATIDWLIDFSFRLDAIVLLFTTQYFFSQQFDLVCDKSTYGQHIITISSFGSIAGSIIAGIVSDKFGRKTAFFLSGLVVSSLLLLVSFSQNYLMFAIPMFFIGLAYCK